MEPPNYARYRIPTEFVGHPIAEQFEMEPRQASARQSLNVTAEVGLFPGSRVSEVAQLGMVFLTAAARLLRRRPTLRFIAPVANARCRQAFEYQLAGPAYEQANTGPEAVTAAEWEALRDSITLVDGRSHQVWSPVTACSLRAALRPYQAPASFWLCRRPSHARFMRT
jgi:lipid-A-disaccharide synthase